MSKPLVVTITGAAGQIGYALAFRIAAGELFGKNRSVELRLLDLDMEAIVKKLTGLQYELDDCAFDTLAKTVITTDTDEAFRDSDAVFLVGSRPRTKGMERRDLLGANIPIFKTQGRAINDNAKRDVKVLVVGNPVNTNCYIAIQNAPDLTKDNFSAMLRLDHNRAIGLLSSRAGCHPRDIKKMTIWGNHSKSQVPDISNCEFSGKKVSDVVDGAWVRNEFIPRVKARGQEILELRGASSAGSAANAAICHMKNWFHGTPEGDWVTMGVVSDGSYGIPEGYVYGFPVVCKDGKYEIVQGISIDEALRTEMMRSFEEIKEEADTAKELLG
ncbi:MAG: malate dehydrogenase [Abditibacteriota bacterium]|nr:malate dehydrogenase [Abditibacteriota bacterium]